MKEKFLSVKKTGTKPVAKSEKKVAAKPKTKRKTKELIVTFVSSEQDFITVDIANGVLASMLIVNKFEFNTTFDCANDATINVNSALIPIIKALFVQKKIAFDQVG